MTVGMPKDRGSVLIDSGKTARYLLLTGANGDGGQRVGGSAGLRSSRVGSWVNGGAGLRASWVGGWVNWGADGVGWGSGGRGVVVDRGAGGRDHRVRGGADDGAAGRAVGDRGSARGDGVLLSGVDGVLGGGDGQEGSGNDGETHLG